MKILFYWIHRKRMLNDMLRFDIKDNSWSRYGCWFSLFLSLVQADQAIASFPSVKPQGVETHTVLMYVYFYSSLAEWEHFTGLPPFIPLGGEGWSESALFKNVNQADCLIWSPVNQLLGHHMHSSPKICWLINHWNLYSAFFMPNMIKCALQFDKVIKK